MVSNKGLSADALHILIIEVAFFERLEMNSILRIEKNLVILDPLITLIHTLIYYKIYNIHGSSTEGFFLNNASFLSKIYFITWFFFSLKYSLVLRLFQSMLSIFFLESIRLNDLHFNLSSSLSFPFNSFCEQDLSTFLFVVSFDKCFWLSHRIDIFLFYLFIVSGSFDR